MLLKAFRALQKLESLIGRDKTVDFVKENIGNVSYKFCLTNAQLFEFRQKLNQKIVKKVNTFIILKMLQIKLF
mgnify:CR=1 FL=1